MIERSKVRPVNSRALAKLVARAKTLAKEYRSLTGRPLGITGEVAEYEACRLLNLCLAPVRTEGHDAIRITSGEPHRVQIKGRVLFPGAKPGQKVGRIDVKKKDWDYVVLVTLDPDFEPITIYEAERAAVVAALDAPGSKARTERGQLSLSKFRAISSVVWQRT